MAKTEFFKIEQYDPKGVGGMLFPTKYLPFGWEKEASVERKARKPKKQKSDEQPSEN